MKRRALLGIGSALVAAGFLGACADTRQLVRGEPAEAVKLAAADTVLITVPEDGTDGQTVYRGSGHQTARLVLAAFLKHTHAARLGPYAHGFDEALGAARQMNQKYLAQITILRWDAGTTEWSALSDQVELKIELVEAATGATVASGRIVTKGAITSFQRKGPQELIAPSLEAFVASLYPSPGQ